MAYVNGRAFCSRMLAFLCGLESRGELLSLRFPALARATDMIPSESRKVRDPATEFEITRLTDPVSELLAAPTTCPVCRIAQYSAAVLL